MSQMSEFMFNFSTVVHDPSSRSDNSPVVHDGVTGTALTQARSRAFSLYGLSHGLAPGAGDPLGRG